MEDKPKKVFKYRKFNDLTLDSLVSDNIYYSSPSAFNDPFDCSPSLVSDSINNELEKILAELIKSRVTCETQHNLKNYIGKKSTVFSSEVALREANKTLKEIEFYASDPSYDDEPSVVKNFMLTNEIKAELLMHYNRGVSCFSTDFKNLLMWSHYGDEHKGICIGYDLDRVPAPVLNKVLYGGQRKIKTSLVKQALIDKDDNALHELHQNILLRKASAWKYEKEWRLLGPVGIHDSPLRLSEITFGLRCDPSIVLAIVKVLEHRDVNFYQIEQIP